jgi:hypothetical protein
VGRPLAERVVEAEAHLCLARWRKGKEERGCTQS